MKNKLWLVLLMLLALKDNTFCNKFDTPMVSEKPASESTNNENSNAENSLPTLTISHVSSITCVSAHIEYQIIYPGNTESETLEHGVCWSTNSNPTLNDNKTVSNVISGLNSGTTYYVRAYTRNITDTAYSDQVAFTTNTSIEPNISAAIFPLSLSCTGVIIAYNITDDGGNPVINKGICWATEPNPTIEDNLGYNNYYDMIIDDVIYHSVSYIYDLQPGTQYHARPCFITSAGTFYGDDISFITNSEPTIITSGVTDITSTSAKVIGNITSTGGSFVVERGIIFDTVPKGFGLANHFIEQEVQSYDGAGEFTVSMMNLAPGTRYYVSTFVGVMTGLNYGDQIIEYGDEITFTTKNVLSVTHATCNVDSDTGSITFDINSNTSWTVSDDADWLAVIPTSGVDNRTITVTYNANTTTSPRVATIIVSGEVAISDTVTFTQSGIPFTLTVLPDNLDVSYESGDTTFYISSNADWTISDDKDWVTVSPISGSGNDTIIVNYDANTNTQESQRVGTITISVQNMDKQSITITQKGTKIFSIDPGNYDVSYEAGDATFNISSNTSWTISDDADWFTVSPISGNDNGSIILTFTANTMGSSRVATITISGTGVNSQIVTVTQSGNPYVFVPSLIDLKVTIYPNPVKDYLFIKFDDATLTDISVSVIDVSARRIIQRNFENIDLNKEQILDLSSIKSGIYFLEIRSEKNSRVYKIIKE